MRYVVKYEGNCWYAGSTDEGDHFSPHIEDAYAYQSETAAIETANQLSASLHQALTKFDVETIEN